MSILYRFGEVVSAVCAFVFVVGDDMRAATYMLVAACYFCISANHSERSKP